MIIEFADLTNIRKNHKDKKIVLAGGVFDILHRGHIDFLKTVKEQGDIAVIAISNDERVKERKGPERPIKNEKERIIIIDSIKYVDYTVAIPEWTDDDISPTTKIIKELKPDLFITIDERFKSFRDKIESFGTKLKIISVNKVSSSTYLINKIKNLKE